MKFLKKFYTFNENISTTDELEERYFRFGNIQWTYTSASMKESDWVKFIDGIHDQGIKVEAITKNDYDNHHKI
jgi:hypothetical protein